MLRKLAEEAGLKATHVIIWKKDGAEYLKKINDVVDEDLEEAYGGYILAQDKAVAWILRCGEVKTEEPRKATQANPHKAVPTQKLELNKVAIPEP